MAQGKRIHRLLCYDIACPRRLARVHRLVSGHALQVQYSVYYLHISARELAPLLKALERLIDPRQDDIRVYPLPARPRMVHLGRGMLPEGVQLFDPKALNRLWH